MIANGNVEIEEQENGTYVFPAIQGKVINGENLPYTWALFIYKNGEAELYQKRDKKTGSLLGKPIKLGNPWDFCDHDTETIPKGDPRNPYKTDNSVCKKCGREFRTLFAGRKSKV
jgi:hypothetical protein